MALQVVPDFQDLLARRENLVLEDLEKRAAQVYQDLLDHPVLVV